MRREWAKQAAPTRLSCFRTWSYTPYPSDTKNALKSWHREYEHSHDLQVGYVRSRQKYSTEQKQAAHPLDCGRPANPNTPGNSKTGGHRHDERHPVRRLNAADLKNRAGV
ncbi:MAG: hypothetical protein B7Y42_07970 [Polaromonas sp. 28-63-22]|nr:MAG: hypothetical protein B7Y42_07970 [Polaromonas sp. 28-63-22]